MKKAIFKGFAVAALALAVLFTGCKNESSNIETVKADAVEITAVAYPGYNYVTWGLSEKYPKANIIVMRDDGTVLNVSTPGTTVATTTKFYYTDFDIKDGVTYKYTAYVDTTGIDLVFQYNNQVGGSTPSATQVGNIEETTAYLKQGNSSSASCKAINPICIKDGKLMTALDLCEYEDGCNEDYIINADNIVVEFNPIENKYFVAFPTKEYLKYTPKIYKGNKLDMFGFGVNFANATNNTLTATTANTDSSGALASAYVGNGDFKNKFYTNDTAVRYNGLTLAAGEYTVVVDVSAQNTAYSHSVITAAKKIVVEKLDYVTATTNVKAGYIDEGKTVRVLWTPAVKADKSKWAAANYTVYAIDSFGNYTLASNAKKARLDEDGEAVVDEDGNPIEDPSQELKDGLQLNEVVYYLDYAITNNKVAYTFAVVLSDNGKFENEANTYTVDAFDEIGTAPTVSASAQFNNVDNNDVNDDAVLTISVPSNNGANATDSSTSTADKRVTVTAKYKVVTKNANGNWYGFDDNAATGATIKDLWLDTEYTDIALTPNTDYTTFNAILKNQAIDSKVIFLYKVSQPNKKDRYDYAYTANPASISAITISNSEYSFADVARTDMTTDPKVKFTLTPSDSQRANYTYEIFYAKKSVETTNTATNASYENIAGPWGSAGTVAFTYKDNVWKYEVEIPLPVATPVYGTARDDAGALKVTGYKDDYVFKLVKTNKNVAASATGNGKVFYIENPTLTSGASYSKNKAN